MHRELNVKATECKPCTVIGKNLKSIVPAKQFHPLVPCVEPNQEIQMILEARFLMKRVPKFFFLAAIDLFSKYPTACSYDKANEPDVLKIF